MMDNCTMCFLITCEAVVYLPTVAYRNWLRMVLVPDGFGASPL